MQSNNHSIILLLVILIAVINGKQIATYIEWLRFKIRTYFKQIQNYEHNDSANIGSSTVQGKRSHSL